jgi:glycosyltransferase involved in cell wall biosynthesis
MCERTTKIVRIAVVNLVWHPHTASADATLERFTTLTGWAAAIRSSGDHHVEVFQRFHRDTQIERGGVTYRFVADTSGPMPAAFFRGSRALVSAIAAFDPHVVHVNGLHYPAALRRLARALPRAAVAVQDHGGFDLARLSRVRRAWMRWGLGAASALLVATPPQADAFRASGLVPSRVRISDVMEGGTTLRADPSRAAHTPLALLCVGRLNANKDPLTVARGFALFAKNRPGSSLTFVYHEPELEAALRGAIDRDTVLGTRVTLRGPIAHERLEEMYARADIFVLGSHREGSGYAALEAMACGVVPVLSDIPPFRWLTDGGRVGALWAAGDPVALCAALERVASQQIPAQRAEARARFERCFSWDAIGRRAVAIYEALSRT